MISIIVVIASGVSCTRKEQKTSETSSMPVLKKRQNLETFGVVKPVNVKNVIIDFSAAVESINAKEGQRVNKGETIMILNIDEFKQQIIAKETELRVSRLELYNLTKQYGSKNTAVSIQREKVKEQENELKYLNSRLTKSYLSGNNIISDMENGVVFDLGYTPGDILSPGSKLFSIASLDSMVIQADVPEEFIKDVNMDAEVEIIPTKDKSQSYKGKVTRISEMAVQKNGDTVFPVEISIDNPDGLLSINSNVDLEIGI
jgi:multidrug resistance efflux pump